MEGLYAVLLAVLLCGGVILPPVGLAMSLREWLRIKSLEPPASWRRKASIAGFTLLTLCVLLWIYAVFREFRNDYSYVFRSAQLGRWLSLVVFSISLCAENKLRRYLLIGALGLFFFFAICIGELP